MTIIDFEFTNWLPHSFLVWNLRYAASMGRADWTFLEEFDSRSGLEISKDNFRAIGDYRINLWQAPGYFNTRAFIDKCDETLNSVD